MEAIVTGVVDFDPERGCLWLAQADGTRYPVVWPRGTTGLIDDVEGFTIQLADGRRIHPGDRVRGTGGYVPAETWEQISARCVQNGEVAVFNARSEITIEEGVGLDLDPTLVGRLSLPATVPLELIGFRPNGRSVVVVDLVRGTIQRYLPDDYVGPTDTIDGASGGGGFIHLWSQGTVWSYPGGFDADPLVYRPDPVLSEDGAPGSLRVVPAPDGEHTWLVQLGSDATLVEPVNLVEAEVTRLGSFQLEGAWIPVGSTISGLVLVSDEPQTILVDSAGETVAAIPGEAISVGRHGAAIVRPDGGLVVADAGLGAPVVVGKPTAGTWRSIGGPVVPADAPPLVTGATRHLVYLADDPGRGEADSGAVVVVDEEGSASILTRLTEGSHAATWSRDGKWVAVVEVRSVTLIPAAGGEAVDLGEVIPSDHWIITAG